MSEAKTIADLAIALKGLPRDRAVVMILTPEGPKPLGYRYPARCWVDGEDRVHVLSEIGRAPQGMDERPLIVLAPAGLEWER